MIRRLSSILLAQSLIVLTTISSQAQSQATLPPVPIPNVTLVPVASDSYPLGAANREAGDTGRLIPGPYDGDHQPQIQYSAQP